MPLVSASVDATRLDGNAILEWVRAYRVLSSVVRKDFRALLDDQGDVQGADVLAGGQDKGGGLTFT